MIKKCYSLLLLVSILCFNFSSSLFGADAMPGHWTVKESPHYLIYYPDHLDKAAEKVLFELEYHRDVLQLTSYVQPKKIALVLEDHGLNSNGIAYAQLQKTNLWAQPPGSYDFMTQYENWFRVLAIHETTHLSHLIQSYPPITLISTIFGPISLNVYSPKWLTEGVAVMAESSISPNEGRLHDAYTHALLHASTYYHTLPTLGTLTYPINTYPLGQSSYVIGGPFVDYINSTYGNTALKDYFKSLGSSIWLFPFSTSFEYKAKHTFGKSLSTLYKDWQETLPSTPFITGTPISTTGWFKSHVKTHNDHIYYIDTRVFKTQAFTYDYYFEIKEYNPKTNVTRLIKTVLSRSSTPFQFYNNALYIGLSETKKGFANIPNLTYGTETEIVKIDLDTLETHTLTKGPFRAFEVTSENTLILASYDPNTSLSTLWSYKKNNTSPLGTVPGFISELETHQATLYAIAKTPHTSWNLYTLSLSPLALNTVIEDNGAITHISSTDDGLLYTVNKGHTLELHTYNPSSQTATQLDTDASYVSSPAKLHDTLFFRSLSAKGEDIFSTAITDQHPVTYNQTAYDAPTRNIKNTPITTKHLVTELNRSLVPYNRLFPFLAAGTDHLSLFDYTLYYNFSDLTQFTIQSRLFAPLLTSITFQNDTTPYLKQTYTIAKHQKEGLKTLRAGYLTDFDDTTAIGGYTTWKWVKHSVNADLYKGLFGLGWRFNGSYRYQVNEDTQLRVALNTVSDYPFTESARGQELDSYSETSAYTRSLEVTKRLKQLNKSVWTPSLFVGDVYGTFFIDHSQGVESFSSVGLELDIETGSFMHINTVVTPGLALYENTFKVYINLLIQL